MPAFAGPLRLAPVLPRRVAVALSVVLAGFVGLAGIIALAAPASAATAPLTFTPGSGADITPMAVAIPGACPAAATNVVGNVTGKGLPPDGQTVINNSTSGVNHQGPFPLPLQDTFSGFAAENGTKLSGPYTVTVKCINRLGTKVYASFSGVVTFRTPTSYTAAVPTQKLIDQMAAAQQPLPIAGNDQKLQNGGGSSSTSGSQPSSAASASTGSTAPSDQASTGTSSAGSGATGSSKGGVTSAGTGSGDTAGNASGSSGATSNAASEAARKSSGGSWQPWLVGGAILLIAFAILMRVRERRLEDKRAAAKAARKSGASKPKAESTDGAEPDDADKVPAGKALTGASKNAAKGSGR